MEKKVAIYTRVSTFDQFHNYSLLGQILDCRKYAEEKRYVVVAEFQETFSGLALFRPELNKLRNLLDLIDGVVCFEFDRLSRNAVHLTLIETEFRQNDCSIEYVIKHEDLKAAQNAKEYQYQLVRKQLELGRERRVKSGKVSPIRAPYGYIYNKQNGTLEINEEEAEIVRKIFFWYVYDTEKGKPIGKPNIAKRLTYLKIPIPNKNTRNAQTKKGAYGWNAGTINYILRNEAYMGIWYYNKRSSRQKISADIPVIITQELWEKAQEVRLHRHGKPPISPKSETLMATRLRCSKCDGVFYVIRNGKWNRLYYMCYGQRNHHYSNYQASCKRYIKVRVIDPQIWEAVISFLKDTDKLLAVAYKRQKNIDKHLRIYRLYSAICNDNLLQLNNELEHLYSVASRENDAIIREILEVKIASSVRQIKQFEQERANFV